MKFQNLTLFFLLIGSACSPEENQDAISPPAQFALSKIQEVVGTAPEVSFIIDKALPQQAFSIEKEGSGYRIRGGDDRGLMYGGLELSELLSSRNQIPFDQPVAGKPYIKKRGLKFNIPLDIRTPSYQDAGDAAQNNIADMWNMEFWKAYLDRMAEFRYNVLTLWNPHPFPSMIKMEDYPNVALDNVCGTSFPLDTDRTDEPDADFIAGCGVSQQVLDNLVVLRKMTIDEKITFWRDVMTYAKGRGIDVYFITWNIWMNSLAPPGWYRRQENLKGNEGKYGINNDQTNDQTIAYLRSAVKQFILTYPDLAGIGVTAGENMEDRDDQYDREKWLWSTYGEGVMDAKKVTPNREVEFIHRFWQSGVEKIKTDFLDKYPDEINLSFKYARARMYATPDPAWADDYINNIQQFGLKSWWNIRNDDIFNFRWGDPEYASAFIKNIPPEEVTAGYYMGSDGYVWGREFTSKHPLEPRELEIDKHWYNFMLWGRMGYNPNLSLDRVKTMLSQHYPGAPIEQLFSAWALASKIPSNVTKFHWHNWDFQWNVEGCLDLRNGFHTINDFIKNPVMENTGLVTIPQFAEGKEGITPFQIADQLDSMAQQVLNFTFEEEKNLGKISIGYDELIHDLKAWAYMGHYYADKIRGATYYYLSVQNKGNQASTKAVQFLNQAKTHWEDYSAAATRNYEPQFFAKTRTVDWKTLTREVERDIQIAKKGK